MQTEASKPDGEKFAFAIMHVGSDGTEVRQRADKVQKYVLEPVLSMEEFGLRLIRADLDPTPGAISPKMIGDLLAADVVIADLTGRSPNVFYELGVAHAFGKRVVTLGQPSGLPFDLQDERVIPLPPLGEKLDVEDAETAKAALVNAMRLVSAPGYTPMSPITNVAVGLAIDQLAPSNPIAAELAIMREQVTEIWELLRSERANHQLISEVEQAVNVVPTNRTAVKLPASEARKYAAELIRYIGAQHGEIESLTEQRETTNSSGATRSISSRIQQISRNARWAEKVLDALLIAAPEGVSGAVVASWDHQPSWEWVNTRLSVPTPG